MTHHWPEFCIQNFTSHTFWNKPSQILTCFFRERAKLSVATMFPLVFTEDAVYVQRLSFGSPRWPVPARWTGFRLTTGTLHLPVSRVCRQAFWGSCFCLIHTIASARGILHGLGNLLWSAVDHIAHCLFKFPQPAGAAGWFRGSSGGLFLLQGFSCS